MHRRKFYLFYLIISATFLSTLHLNAQTDVNSTVALSDKLNDLGMFDLSFYLIDKEIRSNPREKDKLMVQRAQVHFMNREEEKGMKILKTIPTSSRHYPFSRLILGLYLVKKNQLKEATVPLEQYCAKVKRNPPKPEEKFRVEEFQKAIVFLQHAYKQLGDTKNAVKVTEYLKVLLPPKKKKTKTDVYQELVFASQVRLDIAQQMRAEGKEGWEKDVQDAMIPLGKILKDPEDLTVFSILAFNEQLRALVMLNKLNDAGLLIREWKEMTLSLDSEFEKVNLLHEAPSAKMYLWIAEYHLALAETEKVKPKRIELNSKAIKDFYRVFTSYDKKLCPYIPAAARGFNKAKIALEKDGKIVEAQVKPPANFEIDRANSLYDKEEYGKAIPVILKILRADGGKNAENTPDLLSKLTDCYMKTDKMLEAIAIAGFMGDCFPDSPNTPLFLLKIGETKWKEFKKSPGTPEGEKAKKIALTVYEWYAVNCPTHKYASDIAAKIAMEYYVKAADMAIKANAMPEGPGEIGEAKLKANAEAREEFKNVIPKFEYIVDNYSHTKRGKEAAFIMGNCYSNSYQYLKGAEVFKKYCDLEINHPKKKERNMGRAADAKFRMSDNFAKYADSLQKQIEPLKQELENAPETVSEGSKQKSKSDIQQMIDEKDAEAKKYLNLAVTNFKELTENWVKPGGKLHGLTGEDKQKVNSIVSHTIAYIPWVYDRAGDQEKTIIAFSEFLRKFPDHKSVPGALKRRAFLYIDKGETQRAAKDFDTLSTKYPEKAKTIQFNLAKAMYQIKNYEKSVEAVSKLFEGNSADITVSQLRWISRNMIDCGGKHPKDGALLGLKASNLLLSRLKDPVIGDWISKGNIAELEVDKAKLEQAFKVIKDQVLLVGADAGYYSGKYEQSLKFLNDILTDKKTPYFYSAHFKRGEVYRKMEQYSKALKDFGEISNVMVANPDAKESMSFKNQVLVGMTYIQQGDLGKATAALAAPTMSTMAIDNDLAGLERKEVTKEEKALQVEYAEYALFLTACCENKLNKEKATSLVDLYRKSYPNGKFKREIADFPTPEEAVEKIKINVF